MYRFTTLFSLAASFAGCAIEDANDDIECADGKCDGGKDRCYVEARYDDGTCDNDCPQADADCFRFFDDQAAASTWFTGFEATQAMQQVREPRGQVATSDPRFVRMRELLDRGWASYRNVMPVRMLPQQPELVLIDDDTANAFVAKDVETNKAAWVVMVQTGAMNDQSDEALLGVVMHELAHATNLHMFTEVADRIRIHYQTEPGEPEPFGYQQKDQASAREAITTWRALGLEAGSVAYAELNGMPLPGSLLSMVMNAAIAKGDPAKCEGTPASTALNQFVTARTAPLTSLLELKTATDKAQLDQLTRAYLTHLRDVCLAGSTLELIPLMAAHFGVPVEVIEGGMSAEDKAAIDGKHIIDQIATLTSERHRLMRELAATVQINTGRDMTTLRYFSTEEEADDVSVAVLKDMGLDPAGVGTFFMNLFPDSMRNQCSAAMANGMTPPYGDLVDEHHATCWRIAHVRQLGAAKTGYAAPRGTTLETPFTGDYARFAGSRLPRPRLPSDDVMY